MLYSPTCQHAIRALTHLALLQASGPVLVREIAEAEGIPQPTLSKILHGLGNQGLVRSTKGPGGGFELARPARDIRVSEIVAAVDGPLDLEQICILGLDECSDEESCALHDPWVRFRDRYWAAIRDLTLDDLRRTLKRKRSLET